MRTRIVVAAILALVFLSARSYAQSGVCEPGMYAVTDAELKSLDYVLGGAYVEPTGFEGIGRTEVLHEIFRYAGASSGVDASSGRFILSLPKKKPGNMMLIPLAVNLEENRREFDNAIIDAQMPFEWKKLGGKAYEITATDLPPGEYAFVFSISPFYPYEFTEIYGFTIPSGR